jgi:hypothetical protein
MAGEDYFREILKREAVDTSPNSPVLAVRATLLPIIQKWAGQRLLAVAPSGSFAKGTANRSGTDIDLFISLAPATQEPLGEIYERLFDTLVAAGYSPKRQNVSLNLRVGTYDVDLVPAKRQDNATGDHSLYVRRAATWRQTNVAKHILYVQQAGRASETRILKLWRTQKGLDFLSFYLELTVIEALRGHPSVSVAMNVLRVLHYIHQKFETARVEDPANTNNVLSDELTATEKSAIARAAGIAINAPTWQDIVR